MVFTRSRKEEEKKTVGGKEDSGKKIEFRGERPAEKRIRK